MASLLTGVLAVKAELYVAGQVGVNAPDSLSDIKGSRGLVTDRYAQWFIGRDHKYLYPYLWSRSFLYGLAFTSKVFSFTSSLLQHSFK